MSFTPTTATESTNRQLARFVATSGVSDLAEAGTAVALFTVTGQERASIDNAIQGRLNAKFLDVSGPDLDEAASKLPNGGVTRLGNSAASGAVLILTRTDTTGVLVVPAGTTYGRSDNPSLQYVQTSAVTFLVGEATKGDPSAGYVPVQCAQLGVTGNCPTGTIDTILSGPAGLTSVFQAVTLGGGQARESDEAFRLRALLYLQSYMNGNQQAALRYLALTYQSTGGVRARHAAIYFEPLTLPGYVELVVDDGSAFAGQTRAGTAVTGTIDNGQRQILLEGPIADDNLPVTALTVNGSAPSSVYWSLLQEGGEFWFDAGSVSNGDTFAINSYTVYTGFIAELQAVILGTFPSPLTGFGWAAAGCRVRVMPPTQNLVRFSLNIVVVSGADPVSVGVSCETVITEYCQGLAPGKPFLLMDAYAALRSSVPDLVNATFNALNTSGQPCVYQDTYPSSQRSAIRVLTFEVT